MDVRVVLSSDEIIRGLKHYRRIAKQDVLRAPETDNPDVFRLHAEARRAIYAQLTEIAETQSPNAVVLEALECYKGLPFVSGTGETEHSEIKGQENALENFFLMIGLEPKVRREARSQRPKLSQNGTH
ncbi:MAG: hypothetical protein AVDCRST_MAG86-4007 [uncultured Truepera sp.]|uniref:Uncharacterized protein n=1 Tax=uncultured Truepera sp. TaxID=543023 RepID=A0A6J4VT89_9DEIN|nr:MAG: hypothetical protein AVDCRST_MAG86-4007 [uncultured Truepera sp.]